MLQKAPSVSAGPALDASPGQWVSTWPKRWRGFSGEFITDEVVSKRSTVCIPKQQRLRSNVSTQHTDRPTQHTEEPPRRQAPSTARQSKRQGLFTGQGISQKAGKMQTQRLSYSGIAGVSGTDIQWTGSKRGSVSHRLSICHTGKPFQTHCRPLPSTDTVIT